MRAPPFSDTAVGHFPTFARRVAGAAALTTGQRLLLLAGMLAGAPAAAQLSDTLHPYAGVGYSYDDNLFRLSDGATGPGFERSDTSRQAYAGLEFERPIGRQLITASAKVTRVSFDRYSEIDYNAKDIKGNWAWQLGNHLNGNIGGTYTEMLTPFSDYHATDRNLRTQRGEYADLNWRFHPSWQAHGRLNHDEYSYDLLSQRFLDRNVNGTEAGVDYLAASGSTVGLVVRRLRAAYPNAEPLLTGLFDQSYTQTTASVKVLWKISGTTQLQVLGGHARRKHNSGSLGDSSGTNGRADLNWAATPLLQVNGALWRQYQPFEGTGVSHSLDTGASVGVTWLPLNAVKVDGELRHVKRDFEGPLTTTLLRGAEDKSNLATLTTSYQWRKFIALSASLFKDQRSASSFYSTSYRAKGASVFVNVQF